jgi:hypothetical protein
MSRYYFNLEGDGSSAVDLVGRDLASDEAAKTEAVRFASQFDSPDELAGMLAYQWIEVIDHSQRAVARLPLGHANDEPTRLS